MSQNKNGPLSTCQMLLTWITETAQTDGPCSLFEFHFQRIPTTTLSVISFPGSHTTRIAERQGNDTSYKQRVNL